MPKPHEVYLHHINDEIRFLQSLPEFSDGPSLKRDDVKSRAVVRSLEIIGEHEEIPWRRIIELRNRLIYDYILLNLGRFIRGTDRSLAR